MKRYPKNIIHFIVLLCLWQQSYGDITATSPVTYTSGNPKIHPGTVEANMIHLSVSQIMQLDYRNRFDGGILANAAGGEARLRIYYYRSDAVDGKKMLLYEVYTHENSGSYIHNSNYYNKDNWLYDVIPCESSFWSTGRIGWSSDDLETPILEAAEDYQRFHDCWTNWNTDACGFSRGMSELAIPVVVELTMHHATVQNFKIPGHGVIDPSVLVAIPPISIKGTNYEVVDLKEDVLFGHSENRFEFYTIQRELTGKKITGLYDGGTSPDCYFKLSVTTGSPTYIALPASTNINSTVFAGLNPTMFSRFRFAEEGIGSPFVVYKLNPASDQVVKFTATKNGPFVIGDNFDVSFKEDLALPANKRKLFHRGDWLTDVLVCAHRGLWSKVGRHDNPDFSGIAENTIPAYELAINDPNIDWIEFDARRTSDGVFVAWHDDGISRVSSFPDDRDVIPVKDVNARDKVWRDEHRPTYHPDNLALKNKTWAFMKDLHVRDYLGSKVKDASGNFMHPMKLEEGFAWLNAQKALGKHSVISVDYKDGLKYLDEVYELILKYDLEGQVLLSVYAKEYSLANYQAEYGQDFLKQIPLKPTFYEPVNLQTDYGGNVLNRFNDFINAPDHFVAGFTLNVNYDQDNLLIAVLKQPGFSAIANRVWYMSHYNEPFMASITDNNRLNTTADCDPRQHPLMQLCCNLFWRADFDWLLNNGTNAIFSDNTEALVEYLKAKGKK